MEQSKNTCRGCAGQEKQAPDEKLLEEILKNTKMGSDAMITLLGKLEDTQQPLRQDLATQLDGYQNFAAQATRLLVQRGKTPTEPKRTATLPSQFGIQISTLTDHSPSKLAELVINGSTMGIVELSRAMHRCGTNGCAADVQKLGQDVLNFEEGNLSKMKTYL